MNNGGRSGGFVGGAYVKVRVRVFCV